MKGIPYLSRKMVYIGRSTYAVMMHHTASFMLVKAVFYVCSLYTPFCAEFDREMFFGEISFVYLVGGSEASKWLYLFVGIGLPLVIAGFQEKAGRAIRERLGTRGSAR